jgi:NAD(P)-dependent dehydrogenase (short-subunit alcohol dehydrogenase family)
MLATAQDGCIHTNHSGDRPMLLKDRVAIITGGAGINGLGFATARQMAAQGARVAILDLERADPAGAAARLGGRHLGLVADVTDKAACEAAAAAVLRAFGRIDALVNNAGITQAVGTLEIGGADYDRVLDVSLRGTLYMSQAVLPAMRTRRSGAIVCISSVSAQRGGGIFGGPHYSAAKAGVLGLARAMAREFGGDGIRVNCVTPGLIETDITQGKLAPSASARSPRRFHWHAWAAPTMWPAPACSWPATWPPIARASRSM